MNGFAYRTNLFVYDQNRFLRPLKGLEDGTVHARDYGMKDLRERGIYLAPNGESFVASRERNTTSDGRKIMSRLGNRLSCFLFRRYEWAFHGMPDYEVGTTGSLLPLKQSSDFCPDQLIDTGATAGAH